MPFPTAKGNAIMRLALTLATVFGMLIGARAQELRPWGAELQPILEALDQAGLSGSVELSGKCDPAHLPGFPEFHSVAMSRDSAIQTLRGMVSDLPAMRVGQDSDGTIRMKETGVPQDSPQRQDQSCLTRTHGHKGIYTADSAVQIIMTTPEVVAFLKEHDIVWRGAPRGEGGIGGGPREWPPGRPHLVGPLDNVTVSEALDRVLQSFSGELLV
jgi:hypothetical protein